MDIWIVSTSWTWQTSTLLTFVFRSFYGLVFLFVISLGQVHRNGRAGNMKSVCLTFKETPKLLPKGAVLFYIPPAVGGLSFLHIFNEVLVWGSHFSGQSPSKTLLNMENHILRITHYLFPKSTNTWHLLLFPEHPVKWGIKGPNKIHELGKAGLPV